MRTKVYVLVVLAVASLLVVITPQAEVFAQQRDANVPGDFFDMSIEELMEVEVTTASKKAERDKRKKAFSNTKE